MQERLDKSTVFRVGGCFAFCAAFNKLEIQLTWGIFLLFSLNGEIHFSNWKILDSMPPCRFSVGQNDAIALYIIIKRPHQTMQVSCNVMITVLDPYQLKNMTNWILEYSFNYTFGCPHRYRQSVKILCQFVLWQAWKVSWEGKGRLEAQSSACVAVSPNPAVSSEPAHGESNGKENLPGTPRRRRKVLLLIGVRAAFPAWTRASLWGEVASCSKRRPVWDDGRNQGASHSTASVSVFLQELEALFERTWFLLPNYSLCNYILVASSTPAVSIECTDK